MIEDGIVSITTIKTKNDPGGFIVPDDGIRIPDDGIRIPDDEKLTTIERNPWIPGNEPDKDGWYEITSSRDQIVYISWYDWGQQEWAFAKNVIIAYKPIQLSSPYV